MIHGDQRALAVVDIGRPRPDPWFPRNPRLSHDQAVTTV